MIALVVAEHNFLSKFLSALQKVNHAFYFVWWLPLTPGRILCKDRFACGFMLKRSVYLRPERYISYPPVALQPGTTSIIQYPWARCENMYYICIVKSSCIIASWPGHTCNITTYCTVERSSCSIIHAIYQKIPPGARLRIVPGIIPSIAKTNILPTIIFSSTYTSVYYPS